MKLKLFALMLVIAAGVNAQTFMRVHQKGGQLAEFPITSVDSVTHTSPLTSNSIYSVVSADPELTKIKNGIDSAAFNPNPYAYTGNITFFAPVNAVINSFRWIDFGPTITNQVVRYHTVQGKFLASDIPNDARNVKVSTINIPADSIFITKFNGVIYVNGKDVDPNKININASNGVIHKLNASNGILFPPTGSVYAKLSAAGYDSILKLVNRAALADNGLIDLLNNRVVTLIAPTNTAFQQFFSAGAIKEINQLTTAQALGLVKDHILLSRNFYINMAITQSTGIPAYGGGTLRIAGTSQGPALYYIATAAVLLGSSDIMATNGVIHRVGGILTK
jgi:uncharacterized surface protein with fasciclin (FAS1) repeats